MNGTLFVVTALVSTLVLRSGERIEVAGAVRQENGRAVFRSVAGTLYSLPAAEIDEDATRAAANPAPDAVAADAAARPASALKQRQPVSAVERERLLRRLESNHSGQAAPARVQPPRTVEVVEPAPRNEDEWSWRQRARTYEEAVRRAEESVSLLRGRAEQLQSQIRGLLSLGYSPRQFTYQTTTLQQVLEEIPYAELEVTRARRAYEQFLDDARRQNVLPGWLR